MGNSSSRDSGLTIYIETQKQYYNSGSHIEGVIFVQAKHNFQFDALYLRVEGDQWCQWLEGSSKNRQKYTGSQNFYSVQHIIQNYHGTLEAGQYAYPFSLQLSQNIPGSFQSSEPQSKIEYKLAAYFISYKQQNNRQIEYIPLHIRQPFRQQIVSYSGSSTQQPSTCGCFDKGTVKLQAKFQSNVCYQGQNINIQIKIDNSQGNSNINSILVDLVQNVFICANSGINRTFRNSIYSESVSVNVKNGQIQTTNHNFRINTKQKQTAIGTLVANHYRIQVSTNFGSISSDNPCIYAPLFVIKDKDFGLKTPSRPTTLSQNPNDYQFRKMKVFRAPEYWFKKNMNLSVMNFRLEDGVQI